MTIFSLCLLKKYSFSIEVLNFLLGNPFNPLYNFQCLFFLKQKAIFHAAPVLKWWVLKATKAHAGCSSASTDTSSWKYNKSAPLFLFFLTIKKETQTRFCSYFSLCDTVVTTSTGKMTYSALAVIKTHHLGVPVQGNVGGRWEESCSLACRMLSLYRIRRLYNFC